MKDKENPNDSRMKSKHWIIALIFLVVGLLIGFNISDRYELTVTNQIYTIKLDKWTGQAWEYTGTLRAPPAEWHKIEDK